VRRFTLVLCACVVVLAGCSYGFEVLVPADATIDHLAFEFDDFHGGRLRVGPSRIGVYRCDSIRERPSGNYYPDDSEAVWLAHVTAIDAETATDRIAYGIDDHGLQTKRPPQMLVPGGCYVVLIYGRAVGRPGRVGTAGFKVASDLKVVQMTEREYDHLFSKSK